MVVDDDFTGEGAVCGVRNSRGAGDSEAGVIADERGRADRGRAGEFEGLGRVGGKSPVLRGHGRSGCGRADGDEGDLGPKVVGAHEAGEHGREGGIGPGDDDARRLRKVGCLGRGLWCAEVPHIWLGGDVIEGGSGVVGKQGSCGVVDDGQFLAGGNGRKIMGLGGHRNVRGAATEEQKTHADNATRAFCGGKV